MSFIKSYKPYFKTIVDLSGPIIIGQVGIVLMGIADVVMIGKIDSTNLAASGVANSVYFLITILGIGTLTAISPLVAKAHSEEKSEACGALFRKGMLAAVFLSIFICTITFFLADNFHVFKQGEDITVLAKKFLNLLNLSTLPLLLFFAAKQFSDGLSYTKPSAIITIVALLLNIFLNWLWIYGNWGFEMYGLVGAGYATFTARIFMAIAMILYVFKKPQYKKYLHSKVTSANKYLFDIFRVGFPSGLQYFFEIGAFASAAIIIGWIGKNELAAHHIAISIASITYMIATGISAAGSIAVGDALGRRNRHDIIFSGKASLYLGTAFMFCSALMLVICNDFIVTNYVVDKQVATITTGLIYIAAMFQLSDGIQCVSLGVLRGIADTKIPTLITIVAYWGVGLPFGYYMAFHQKVGLYGIWYGLSLALTFSAVMLSIRFLKESKELSFEKMQ